jgi:hypothetical protein
VLRYTAAFTANMRAKSVIFFQNKHHPQLKRRPDGFWFPHERGVAFHNENTFFASGVLESSGNVHFAQFPNASLGTLKDWILKTFGDSEPIESEYVPGTFYKRIFRPLACCIGNFHEAVSQEKVNESFVALRILLGKLDQLFETIEPTTANLLAYGHRIREVLLLACMEVESSWSAVLRENEYLASGALTTNDYVKLFDPMLLDSYQLRLQSYAHFPVVEPFTSWDKANPTKSLAWYDAYNKTKHDREGNLTLATLHNAVQAVGAVVVMFHAQFGIRFDSMGSDQKSPIIRNVFQIRTDFKKHWMECYIPKLTVNENVTPNPSPSTHWDAISYPFLKEAPFPLS